MCAWLKGGGKSECIRECPLVLIMELAIGAIVDGGGGAVPPPRQAYRRGGGAPLLPLLSLTRLPPSLINYNCHLEQYMSLTLTLF